MARSRESAIAVRCLMLARTPPTLLALLLLAGSVRAGGLESRALTVKDAEVRAVRAADLTGDGVSEIAAFADGPEGLEVDVFVADDRGIYASEPAVRVELADRGLLEVYYGCLVRLGRGRPTEFLFVDRRRGVLAMALERDEAGTWTAGKLRTLAPAPPLPYPPDEERMHVLDVGRDLDGDGADELILPSREGYRILSVAADGKAPAKVQTLQIPATITVTAPPHRLFGLSYELPRLTVGDWDGDGLLDLVGGLRGHLLLYLQTKSGGFFPVDQPFSALAPKEADGVRTDLVLGDVNADHRLDLVLSRHDTRVGTLEVFHTRQSLYLNPRIFSPGPEGRLSTPVTSFEIEGVGIHPTLLDFDGDGDLDLLVTLLKVTPGARLRRRVDAEYRLYRYISGRGTFEGDPFFTVTRPYPIGELEKGTMRPSCFFSGDFDGDGRKDLLDSGGGDHLTILSGTTDTGFLSSARYAFREEGAFQAKISAGDDVLVTRLGLRAADDAIAWEGSRILVIRKAR
jgi:hypothetical protein